MDTKKIGERIKYARSLRNYTLEDIASNIGVAKSTIQRYENALIASPKLPVLQAIANSLKVNPAWLSGQDVDMEIETFEQQWDRESDEFCNKMNAFDSQLHALGWNCKWSNDDELYILSNGIASVKITPEEYSDLHKDFEDSCRKHLQKLILKSLSSNLDQELNAAHERTDIEVTAEMRQHDDDIMDDENF